MRSVYLTGFMGAGKSVVGRSLARRMGRAFVDLDAAIEREEGLSVAEIFRRRGERRFRLMEKRALSRAAKRHGAVVALGGGALLDPGNRALVARTGVLVRLTCSRRELVRRLRPQRDARPLLSGGPLEARVAALLRARRKAYAGANLTISTTGLSTSQVAARVARKLP